MIRKSLFICILIGVPLFIIFLAFFEPKYGNLVRQSMVVFTVLAVPYCFFVKDPRKGVILFLLETSLLDGPWKHFTFGMDLKLLAYTSRDLLLYASFLNFLIHKKRILSDEILRQKPPYTGLIFIFLLNIALQIFNPGGLNFLNSISGSRLFWEMIPLYWIGFYLMRDKDNFKILCWLCLLCLFFSSIAAILQYKWGKDKVALINDGYNAMVNVWGRGVGEKLRPPGLGSDMGFAGHCFPSVAIMMIVLFVIPQAKKLEKRALSLAFLIALSIVDIAGLIVSGARSAIIDTIVCLIIFFLLRRDLFRTRTTKILILFALLFFLIIPHAVRMFEVVAKRYESIKNPAVFLNTITTAEKNRLEQAFGIPLQYSLAFFMGNGLGRAGPGAGLFGKGPPALTNSEITLNLSITEIGTIGTILWIVFHIVIVRRGLRVYKSIKTSEWKWYGIIPMIHMLVLIFSWQFGHLISFPANAGFWFMAGTLMGLKYIKEE